MTVTHKTNFSGQRHRKFRRDMATAMRVHRARRDNKPVRAPDSISRALIFPLAGNLEGLDFRDFAADYNVTDGVTIGSLFHYLMTVLSNGFRLRDSASGAVAAELATAYEEATAVIQAATGRSWPELTFGAIIQRLSAQPRVTGGKSVEFAPELVATEWAKTLHGTGDMSKLDPAVRDGLHSLSEHLCGCFDSWKGFQADRPVALRAITAWMSKYFSGRVPDLAALYEQLPQRPKAIQSAPIAFVGAPVLRGDAHYAPHRAVAQLLYEASIAGVPFEKAGSAVVDGLVTTNNNALSWLFGGGLVYLSTTSPAQVASDFRVPADRIDAVEAICTAARAVPAPRLFGLDHYASYRSLVGGKISSWASNYLNRLGVWRMTLGSQPHEPFALPEALGGADAVRMFSGMDVDFPGLSGYLAELHNLGLKVREEVLARVMGTAPGVTDADFEAIERFIALQTFVTTRLNILSNRIEQEIRLAERAKDGTRESLFVACRFYIASAVTDDGESEAKVKFPAWMTPLDRNLGISGGVPDIAAEISAIADSFNDFLDARKTHLQKINAWLIGQELQVDPVLALANAEADKLERAGRQQSAGSAMERARRRILSMFLHQVRLCPDSVRRPIATKLIESGAIAANLLNTFMFNRKAIDVYVSVFSRTTHSHCEMNSAVLNGTNWLDWIDAQVKQVWGMAHKSPSREMIDAAVRLDRVAAAIRMRGLPDVDYPIDIARPCLEVGDLELPVSVQIQIAQPTVRADTVARIVNAYYSAINAATAKLIRPSFVVRTRFQRVGNNELHYVPRSHGGRWERQRSRLPWRIPEGWVAAGSTSPLRALAEIRLGLDAEHREIDVPAVTCTLLRESPDDAVREYLRQAPHGWHFAADLPVGSPLPGFAIDKDFKKAGQKPRRMTTPLTLELTGHIRYKSQLDMGLLSDERIEWGDLTLTAEQVWVQSPALKNGRFVLRATPTRINLFLTVPITETPLPELEVPTSMEGLFDRAVSIDLGERTLGYAVYDCRTGALIEAPQAPVPMPQIAALMKMAPRFSRTVAPMQKFSAKFDRRLEKARNNVIGDVVRQINELCARYKAFPVLESIAGAPSMDPQINLVFQGVLKHFVYSGVQEQTRARTRFWYGGDSIQHPWLQVRRVETKPVTGKVDAKRTRGKGASGPRDKVEEKMTLAPLNLFPGAGVGPKGTSQRDSHCGRNPYEVLDAISGNPVLESQQGRITLPDGTVFFLERRGTHGVFRAIPDGRYRVNDLRQMLRQSMRRPQSDSFGKRRRDTTLSWYKCVFDDCRHEMHADQNGAINIGWKFLNVKIAQPLVFDGGGA